MKNKKLLLVGVAAMGLVAVATAGVGTAAWYKVNSSVSVTPVQDVAAGSITVGASTASSVNGFTITPATASASGAVAYTDANGDTFVSIPKSPSGYTTKAATTTAALAVEISLKATVTYSGDLSVQADVENLWAATVSKVRLTVNCSSVTDSKVAGTPATTDIRGVEDADADAAAPLYLEADDEDFTWTSATTTSQLTLGSVWVALTGSDSLVVDSTNYPTYTLQIDSSYTGA